VEPVDVVVDVVVAVVVAVVVVADVENDCYIVVAADDAVVADFVVVVEDLDPYTPDPLELCDDFRQL
jgi:hypothetical protein